MKLSLNLTTLAMAVSFTALSAQVAMAADDWEKLGCRAVNFAGDHDTITVGKSDGFYKRIKLRVRLAPIEFYKVRVVFGSGADLDIPIQQAVEAGSESRTLDLPAGDRVIQKVGLNYRSIPNFNSWIRAACTNQLTEYPPGAAPAFYPQTWRPARWSPWR